MQLMVNGKEVEVDREMPISDFLKEKGLAGALVAVEHNLQWVAREQWPAILLKDGDRLEIVRAMAGG